jgi:molecular chaperone DnaK
MAGEDAEKIKADLEALTNAFQPLAQKLYAQAEAQNQGGGNPSGGTGEDSVDEADYEVVD